VNDHDFDDQVVRMARIGVAAIAVMLFLAWVIGRFPLGG